MKTLGATIKVANYTFTAVAILAALVALWSWVQAIMWWGSAGAMAQALTWTAVTVLLFGFVTAIEWLQNTGE